jgi:hypothetical protein
LEEFFHPIAAAPTVETLIMSVEQTHHSLMKSISTGAVLIILPDRVCDLIFFLGAFSYSLRFFSD